MPISAPILRQLAQTVQTTSTSPLSPTETVSWKNGDKIYVVAQDEGSATASRFGTPTNANLTFAVAGTNGNGQSSNRAATGIYEATAGSDQSAQTISMTNSAGITWRYFVFIVQDSDGVGASVRDITTTGAAPSVNITTTTDNPMLLWATSDGTATDGASRAFRTPTGSTAAVEPLNGYYRNAAQYTAYLAYHVDAGAAGSKTVGLSTPSGQSVNLVVIEIKGKSTTITGSGNNLLNPIVDVHNQGWTDNAAGTTNLYQAIDEDAASDSDYVQVGTTGLIYEAALESITDPASSTGHILHTRYKKDTAADVVSIKAELMQGSTVLVTRNFSGISTSFTTDDYTLSSGEADSITDYGNLRDRLTPTIAVAAPSKVADRATLNSTTAGLAHDYVLSGLTIGNVLIIRTAADNAGTNGAASTVTVTNQSGTAINVGTSVKFQANADPGAASAGITCNVIVAVITATSGTVRLTYGNSLVQSGVAEEWSGITGAVVGTPVTATNAATAQPSVTDASVASGNLAYVAIAAEGPSTDTYTADSDTTNGSWVTGTKVGQNSGTAASDTTTTSAWKVTTGTGAQAWDNATHTNTRDTAGMILELTAGGTTTAKAVVSWAQLETPSSATTVTGTQASETDTGQHGTPIVTDTGVQATETDTAQAGVPRVTKAGAQATETETAQAGTPLVTKAGAQASEADTAFAGRPIITVAGSQASETDTGQAGAVAIVIVVPGAQATETDTAQAGAPIITVAGSQAVETDTGQLGALRYTYPGAQATETDTGQTGTPTVTKAGTQATETDTGAPGGALVAVAGSQAVETDTGASGAVVATVAGSQATETDTGQGGVPRVTAAGTQATETDTGQAGAPIIGVAIEGAQVVETDTAFAGAPIITVAGSQVTETDTAQAGSSIVGVAITGTQAVEADTAQAGAPIITVAGSQAVETDTAQAGVSQFVYPGTQAVETDTAAAGTPTVAKAGSQVVEADTAQAGALRYTYPGTQATETDTTQAGALSLSIQGAQAVEVDTARPGRSIRPGAPLGIVEPTFVILADDGTLDATLADDGTLTIELDDDGTLLSVDTLLEVAP